MSLETTFLPCLSLSWEQTRQLTATPMSSLPFQMLAGWHVAMILGLAHASASDPRRAALPARPSLRPQTQHLLSG